MDLFHFYISGIIQIIPDYLFKYVREQTALEDTGNVFLCSEGQICLLVSIVKNDHCIQTAEKERQREKLERSQRSGKTTLPIEKREQEF